MRVPVGRGRTLFDEMDASGDGLLDLAEFAAVMEALSQGDWKEAVDAQSGKIYWHLPRSTSLCTSPPILLCVYNYPAKNICTHLEIVGNPNRDSEFSARNTGILANA